MSLGQYGLRKRKKIARGYLLTFGEYSNISAYFLPILQRLQTVKI